MATDPFASTSSPIATSVAESVRRQATSFSLVSADSLPYWLPGLTLPADWTVVPLPQGQPATRMAVCRFTSELPWDGCEVIALYQFAGSVPGQLVRETADSTLRDLNACNISCQAVSLPPDIKGNAVRSSGTFLLGGRWLWGQFTNYVIEIDQAGALIEHSVLVNAPLRARLAPVIDRLTASVQQSLRSSIAAGQRNLNR